jgi:hypothetical protein
MKANRSMQGIYSCRFEAQLKKRLLRLKVFFKVASRGNKVQIMRQRHGDWLIAMAAAIDSLRHPEVRAKRASKDGNTYRLAAILRGPRKSAGTSG